MNNPLFSSGLQPPRSGSPFLDPINNRLSRIQFNNPQTARLICRMIPSHCPFERDVRLRGRTLFHIPALCKLNPFYGSLVQLRFQALGFLADTCGEDVSPYCR